MAKRPGCETSRGRNVLGANRPGGELTKGRNVHKSNRTLRKNKQLDGARSKVREVKFRVNNGGGDSTSCFDVKGKMNTVMLKNM